MKPLKNKIIVIDPGHGGHDSGAVGNGIKEKDVVLSLGLRLGSMLRALGAIVIYTRTTDVYVTLGERAKIANEAKADIFISVHVNAGGGVTANGVEIFSHPTSIPGMELSKAVLEEIVKANIFKANRGNKTANFAVLRRTKMPAILSETGFVDHYGDSQIIKNKEKEIAEAIVNGVLKYFNVPINSTTQPKNYIKLGDRGPEVKELQKNLNRFGWDAGAEDGIFGNKTLASLKNFQRAFGLLITGVYDEASKKIINDALKGQKEDKPNKPDEQHFAEKDYKELNESGIKIHDKRFDDNITRGEVFVIANQLLKKKMI